MVRSRLFLLTFLACAAGAAAHRATAETVLLDFTSPHCGPCAEMEPVLQQLEAQGTKVQRVDVSQDQRLATQFRVEVTPTYIVLIDGQEWARVTGVTPHATMVEMLQHSAELAAANAPASPTAAGPNSVGSAPATLADPFANRIPQNDAPAAEPTIATPPSTTAPAAMDADHAHLIAATVRLSIADPNGKSTGTGAIVAARNGMALVLTCGHLFRESQGRGAIEISIFTPGPNGAELRGKVVGELIDYDLDRDLALVRFRTESQITVTPIAPAGALLVPGAPVVSVGCNHGENPTARPSHITTVNRFQGHPNVEAAGAPVEGRSGGPLFNAQGQVIGVCFAADTQGDEGLYASLASIQAKLDELQLSSVYTTPEGGDAGATAPAGQLAAATAPVPAAEALTLRGQEPTPPPSSPFANQWPQEPQLQPASPASAPPATPAAIAALPPAEQAALEEIARRSDGAEVILIIRPRDPNGRSDVIKLSGVSQGFVSALTASAETASPQTAAVAASPAASTATVLR